MDENCKRGPMTRLWWILSATGVMLIAYPLSLGPVHVLVHSCGLTTRVYALYCPLWNAVDLHPITRGMLDWYERRWSTVAPVSYSSPARVLVKSSPRSTGPEPRPVTITQLP